MNIEELASSNTLSISIYKNSIIKVHWHCHLGVLVPSNHKSLDYLILYLNKILNDKKLFFLISTYL
jgi:hypothetical protein